MLPPRHLFLSSAWDRMKLGAGGPSAWPVGLILFCDFWLRTALRACDLLLVLRALAEIRDGKERRKERGKGKQKGKGKVRFHVLLCTVFLDAMDIFVYHWNFFSGIQLRIRKHQYWCPCSSALWSSSAVYFTVESSSEIWSFLLWYICTLSCWKSMIFVSSLTCYKSATSLPDSYWVCFLCVLIMLLILCFSYFYSFFFFFPIPQEFVWLPEQCKA